MLKSEREKHFAELTQTYEIVVLSEERVEHDAILRAMTATLKEAAQEGDALHAINLERQCIVMEQNLKLKDSQALRNQRSLSADAEVSLMFVQKASEYATHINKVFPEGIKETKDIPKREGMYLFVHHQIGYIGGGIAHLDRAEKTKREYYLARQESLRAGLKQYRALQRKALFPDEVPKQLKKTLQANQADASSMSKISNLSPDQIKREIQALNLVENPIIYANPRTNDISYKGKILHLNEEHGYCVQSCGQRSLYVHTLDRLDKTPEVGQFVQISYPKDQTQKAQVKVLEQKQRRSQRL